MRQEKTGETPRKTCPDSNFSTSKLTRLTEMRARDPSNGIQRLTHWCANHDTEGKRFKSPIHCCDVMKPPYLFSNELCTSPLHCKLLFMYTVCCRRTGQCFSVLRTGKSDFILKKWTAVVGEVTSPSSDTMCHSCAPVV